MGEGGKGRGLLDSDNRKYKKSTVIFSNEYYGTFYILNNIDNNTKLRYYIDNRYNEYRYSSLEMILWQENN